MSDIRPVGDGLRNRIARTLARHTATKQDGYEGAAAEMQVELNWQAWIGDADAIVADLFPAVPA